MTRTDHAIRPGLEAACERALQRIARPGTWWTGAERVAIACETRYAPECSACREQREIPSPDCTSAPHDALGLVTSDVVEVVHHVRNDSAGLSEAWLRAVTAGTLDDAAYAEVVGIVATMVALDTFARALGRPPAPVPAPLPGEPSRHRPPGARRQIAWLSTLSPEDVRPGDPDPYPGKRPEHAVHIHQALSLVPAEAAGFFDLDEELYLPQAAIREFDVDLRAIGHAQMELIAARLSAINQCTY